MKDYKQIVRQVAAGHELATAIRLIQVGLRELQAIDGANDFYHLPFLTLANGLERYLKVILCLRFHETEGRFPNYKELISGRSGHDLTALLKRVIGDCFSESYVTRIPVAAEDIDFLTTNRRLHEVVNLLSRFGQAARYYHLDLVLGTEPDTDSPEDEWARLELELVKERPGFQSKLSEPGGLEETYAFIRHELTVLLERFCRALARLFTIGKLGELAQRNMTYVVPFLMIRDSELGEYDYTEFRR